MPRPHELVTSPIDGLGAMIDTSGKGGVRRSIVSKPVPMPTAPIAPVKMAMSSSAGVAIKSAAPTVTTKTTRVLNTPQGPKPITGLPPVEGAALPAEQLSLKIAQKAGSAVIAQKKQLDTILAEAKSAARKADSLERSNPANAALLRTRSIKLIERAKLVGQGLLESKGRFLRATAAVGGARAVASARSQSEAMANAGKARVLINQNAKISIPPALRRSDRAVVVIPGRGKVRLGPPPNASVFMRAPGIGGFDELGEMEATAYVNQSATAIEAAVRETAAAMGPTLVSSSGLAGLGDINPDTVNAWANSFTTLIQAGKQVETAFRTPKAPTSTAPTVVVQQQPGMSNTMKIGIAAGAGVALLGVTYLALRK